MDWCKLKIILLIYVISTYFFNLYANVSDTLRKEKFFISVGTGYSIGLIDKLNDKRIRFYNEWIPYRGDVGVNILLKYKKILFGIDIFHYSIFKYEYSEHVSCIYNFCKTMSGKYISKNGNSTGFFYKKYRISAGSLLLEKRNYQAGWLIGFNSRTYYTKSILIDIHGYNEFYSLNFHYFFNLWINLKIYERINLILKYENLFAKTDLSGKFGDPYYKGIYLFNNIGFTLIYKVITKQKYEK
jgi:hypothetical protein